ncbi:hypothetical protein [Runella sp.]|uniref:hypothetical protein n=1 Tax=Runella sp. TaxID=1960881 RepID=UPI003D0BFE18
MNNHYFGGKSADGHFHQIINFITPHITYVEPFGGKLGIFRQKREAKRTFVIERNHDLIPFYKQHGFTVYDGSIPFQGDYDNDTECFYRHIMKNSLGRFCLIGDALRVLEDMREEFDSYGVFLYVDPPYPLDSRRDSRPNYKFEMSDHEHDLLLETLYSFDKAHIAISTYENEIYNDWLAGKGIEWNMEEISAQTRHGRVTEQLWMNYPAPAELHDYRYLGADFREREDIIRKQKRWAANFAELSILEQKAMLEILTSRLAISAESGQGKKRKKAKDVSLIQILSQ